VSRVALTFARRRDRDVDRRSGRLVAIVALRGATPVSLSITAVKGPDIAPPTRRAPAALAWLRLGCVALPRSATFCNRIRRNRSEMARSGGLQKIRNQQVTRSSRVAGSKTLTK